MNKYQTLKRITVILFFVILFSAEVSAVGGNLDNAFAPGLTKRSGVEAVFVQTDGKILLGGSFLTMNGTAMTRLARLNADGTLDTTFNIGTGANLPILEVITQADGKILIGGDFTTFNGTARNRIARLNADGSLDTTFVPPAGSADSSVVDLAILPSGKVAAVGGFTVYSGFSRNRVLVLNADGSMDTGFVPATAGALGVNAVVAQADGKIIIGGNFTTPAGRIARLNADGSLDTYTAGTGFNNSVFGLALDENGKAVAVGSFTNYNGTSRNGAARINTDGTLDTGFNIGTGATASPLVNDVQITFGGQILLGGRFPSFNGSTMFDHIVRLFADGSIDMTFNPPNPAICCAFNLIERIAVQTDGKVIAVGDFVQSGNTPRFFNVRFNADGTLDTGFDAAPGGTGGIVSKTIVKPDGKIVAVGDFDFAGRFVRQQIAQINADGTIDTAFNSGFATNAGINAAVVQADGKIVIGGAFTSYNLTAINRFARLNADGTLDGTFTVGTGANNTISAMARQADGKILISGNFTSYNGTARPGLARINADGTLDTTFLPGTGPTGGIVLDFAFQMDGKIIIGGVFTAYNGTATGRLARLNADGSLEAAFNPGANNSINSAALQTDGKILIGGIFTTFNGTPRNRIARVNADGSLDTDFDPGTGFPATVRTVVLQTDGKILAGGNFTTFNGTTRNRLARINADGTIDTTFVPPGGADASVYSIALQADGKILAGGEFTVFNTASRLKMVRLLQGDTLVWNGGASTDWNTAANWTPAQVPTGADAVEIPSVGVTNEPSLVSSVTIAALDVGAGRTVTIPSGTSLSVGGLTNDGTVAGGGTLSLTGAAHANNGTVSANAQAAGAGLKILTGAGGFTGDFAIGSATTLRLSNNHQFGRILNVGVIDAQNFTLSLGGAGDVLTNGLNVGCGNCTINYNGTTAQSIRQIRDLVGYHNLTVNNPAGVTLLNSITVGNNLTLANGTITTGNFALTLTTGAISTQTNGYVIGRLAKRFPAGTTNFIFHTGTANGFSPVVFNATGASASQTAQIQIFQTNQPNLPAANSLARYWEITADAGITSANLVFNYLQTDVAGNENIYRINRVSGGVPVGFPNDCGAGSPCVDAANNTATINNVTQFSDWTLAELAPSAANVTVGGRVTEANGYGISNATVILTAPNGETRSVRTNTFGYFRFHEVESGATYTLQVRHKFYQFAPQILTVTEEITDLNFIAEK